MFYCISQIGIISRTQWIDEMLNINPGLYQPQIYQSISILCLYIEGILPKGPYLPCVSMAGRALLAGYHRYMLVLILPRPLNYLFILFCVTKFYRLHLTPVIIPGYISLIGISFRPKWVWWNAQHQSENQSDWYRNIYIYIIFTGDFFQYYFGYWDVTSYHYRVRGEFAVAPFTNMD